MRILSFFHAGILHVIKSPAVLANWYISVCPAPEELSPRFKENYTIDKCYPELELSSSLIGINIPILRYI